MTQLGSSAQPDKNNPTPQERRAAALEEERQTKLLKSVKIRPEGAIRVARDFIDGLSLEYEATYGTPRIGSLGVTRGLDYEIAGEYSVPVKLRDSDGSDLSFELYIDSQNGSLREGTCYKPSREEIIAAMNGSKQHYLIVTTKDVASARLLTDELYSKEGVNAIIIWDKEGMDFFDSTSVQTQLRSGETKGPHPIDNRVKPEEKDRRDRIKGSCLRY